MAMDDYFYVCNKLESVTVSDGLGGFKTVEYEGVEFKGLAVQKGSSEQLIGALRGNEEVQYTFHTYANVPLKKDDKIKFIEGGQAKYIRLTSNEQVNTEQSEQTYWKTYSAENYTPILVG